MSNSVWGQIFTIKLMVVPETPYTTFDIPVATWERRAPARQKRRQPGRQACRERKRKQASADKFNCKDMSPSEQSSRRGPRGPRLLTPPDVLTVSGGFFHRFNSRYLVAMLTSASLSNHSLPMALWAWGVQDRRHHPFPGPPRQYARYLLTPCFIKKRAIPLERLHCFSFTQRSLRRIHLSRFSKKTGTGMCR